MICPDAKGERQPRIGETLTITFWVTRGKKRGLSYPFDRVYRVYR